MQEFFDQVRFGFYKDCMDCPWNPKIVGPMAFGVSCREHGLDWMTQGHAISMQIVQDPAGTTPEKTGRLCSIHNSSNPRDKTAQHGLDLWKAAVAFDVTKENQFPYLKMNYWTNALMHGANKKGPSIFKKQISSGDCQSEMRKNTFRTNSLALS